MNTLEQLRSGSLAGATRLDLCSELQSLPPEVYGLAETLEVLNLSGNRLRDLPADMGRFKRLRIVFGSGNPFSQVPESLGDCPALQVVGFKACRIQRVDAASLPTGLRWLILTDNAISELPDALGQRPALQKLMLAGNRLRGLPPSLAGASRLELLRISANAFEQLPGWLTELPRLAWLALAGNPLGWAQPDLPPLPRVDWAHLQLGELLGEGASGQIHRVRLPDGGERALKLFKGAVTSDGLPEHERAACIVAGAHPALVTPDAELQGHPADLPGLLLPVLPDGLQNLAGPPSMDSCTRDVYPTDRVLAPEVALQVARSVTDALAHLHERGLMHGDLYAHNTLFDPRTGQAVLSDMGAACGVPREQPALARALLQLEMRALGCLLEELADHTLAGSAVQQALRALAMDGLQVIPARRSPVAAVQAALSRL